jgi:hypothetical protein
MINTAIIALPHSNPVSGLNTPYLQIGFALPFHAKFLTFADKTVDFLGSKIPVSMFYDSTLLSKSCTPFQGFPRNSKSDCEKFENE